jgi:flagellar biosynthetic protein FlhB
MADLPRGEKTEQATPRRLEEAWKKGQFARSSEIQTVFVLFGAILALVFTGPEIWRTLSNLMASNLGHLHDTPLKTDGLQRFFIDALLVGGACVWPVLAATVVGGLLACGMQSRFRSAPDAHEANWDRVNPGNGFRRLFSWRAVAPAGIALVKLALILALSYHVIAAIVQDPIFYSAVDVPRIGTFLAGASMKLILRLGFALMVLAAIDYGYQLWRTNQDLMMTREEVKEEVKNQEGDPKLKARLRSRRRQITQRRMLADVPRADVVVTNPTHLAIALRYDRKTMQAPRIVAKGSRLNALRIREIAQQHQVPILENKPLARMMFKYGRVGGEIPAQLYVAVAEILAYVYRTNAYRYYREQNLPSPS